jgi:hypothetical protein
LFLDEEETIVQVQPTGKKDSFFKAIVIETIYYFKKQKLLFKIVFLICKIAVHSNHIICDDLMCSDLKI